MCQNQEVNSTFATKKQCWKSWKQVGNKEHTFSKGSRPRCGVYGKETVEDQKLADLRAGTTDVFQIPSR